MSMPNSPWLQFLNLQYYFSRYVGHQLALNTVYVNVIGMCKSVWSVGEHLGRLQRKRKTNYCKEISLLGDFSDGTSTSHAYWGGRIMLYILDI